MEPDAIELLSSYEWPGNVRELQNVCERASVLVRDGVMHAEAIRPWLNSAARRDGDGAGVPALPLRRGHILEDMERELIRRTLSEHGGHRVRTAKALGIGVRTLGMKLKRWQQEARELCTAS